MRSVRQRRRCLIRGRVVVAVVNRYTEQQMLWIEALLRVMRNVGDYGAIQIELQPKQSPQVKVLRSERVTHHGIHIHHWDLQGADFV